MHQPGDDRGGMRAGLRGVGADAGARQFPVDMAAHHGDDMFDAVGLFGPSLIAQRLGIAQQRLQRRLEPVRQIAGAVARAIQLSVAVVQQMVQLAGQGRDLGGQIVAQAPPAPLRQPAQMRADLGQRAQAKRDLDEGRRQQQRRQSRQPWDKVAQKGRAGLRGILHVLGHDQADGGRGRALPDQHLLIQRQQALVARPVQLQHPPLARRRRIRGHGQRHVPQRPRPQGLVPQPHLPVMPREWQLPRRVARLVAHLRRRAGFDHRQQNQRPIAKVRHGDALDMAVEQHRQHRHRQRHDQQDGRPAQQHQPQAQRQRPHAPPSSR